MRNRLFGFLDSYTIRALARTNACAKKVRKCTRCKGPIKAGERYRYAMLRITNWTQRQDYLCGTCVRAEVVGDDAMLAQRTVQGQRRPQADASRAFFTVLRRAGVTFHNGGKCNAPGGQGSYGDRCESCDRYNDFMSRPLVEVALDVAL